MADLIGHTLMLQLGGEVQFEIHVKKGDCLVIKDLTIEVKHFIDGEFGDFITILGNEGSCEIDPSRFEGQVVDVPVLCARLDIKDPDYAVPVPGYTLDFVTYVHELRLQQVVDPTTYFNIGLTVRHGSTTIARLEKFAMDEKYSSVENLREDIFGGLQMLEHEESNIFGEHLEIDRKTLKDFLKILTDDDFKAELDGQTLNDDDDMIIHVNKHIDVTLFNLMIKDSIDAEVDDSDKEVCTTCGNSDYNIQKDDRLQLGLVFIRG